MKTMKSIRELTMFILLAPCFLSAGNVQAQTGAVSGTVRDEKGEPVGGATVVVLEQLPSIGTATGADGKFNLNKVPAKTVAVQFSLLSYQTLVVEGVKIAEGKTTPLNVVLRTKPLRPTCPESLSAGWCR
jgi:hypothetical protein